MRMKLCFTIALMCIGRIAVAEADNSIWWTEIQPFNKVFIISNPDKTVIKETILDNKGKALYLFVCRNFNDETANVWYAGDLDCRLIQFNKGEVEENLLNETYGIAAWYSRGRMLAHELFGKCADYPEYGRVRHFYLRGMKLTLTFSEIKFNPRKESDEPRLKSYKLSLAIVPDASAKREIAASSGYLDPHRDTPQDPRSCEIVRTGIEWPED